MKKMDAAEDEKDKAKMRRKIETNPKQAGKNRQKGRKEEIQDEGRNEPRDSGS
jgi:hypothetical protein